MPEINVALIGHRFMGKAHSNAYRQVRRFFPGNLVPRMKVLCGKACTEELEETARLFGWEESDCEWERVVERKDIDIIDVSTPGYLHHPMVIAAAQAGKHNAKRYVWVWPCQQSLQVSLASSGPLTGTP